MDVSERNGKNGCNKLIFVVSVHLPRTETRESTQYRESASVKFHYDVRKAEA